MLTENLVKLTGGTYLTKRYTEIIHPVPQDTRTGDEIAEDVIKRAGLVVTA